MNYENGRYRVIGPAGEEIGMIDHDEFVRRGTEFLYRVDGDEVYSAGTNAKLLGFIDGGVARTPNGQVLFSIEAE